MNGKIYLAIAKFALNRLYNYIDANGDGKLDKKELVVLKFKMREFIKWK